MAGFNLVPNPVITVVQAGLFFVNMYIVKRFILDPYLKLRELRFGATGGSIEKAHSLNQESEKLQKNISDEVKKLQEEITVERDKAVLEASKQKETILAGARKEAEATLVEMRDQISKEVDSQRSQIPDQVQKIYGALKQKISS